MIAHESARQRKLLPLTKADLDARRPGWTKLCLEARGKVFDHATGARTLDRRAHGRQIV